MILKIGYISFILTFFLVLAGTQSCKKKSTEVDMGYDYFPQNEGHYVVYSVHEIYIDTDKDTFDYYIKAVVGEPITDNSGRIARKYERYSSNSANGPWTIKDVWTSIIDGPRAELVEENNRTIKLIFAPSESADWNMNAYNTLEALDCYYSNLNQPYSINSTNLPTTVTVEQEDFTSFIDSRRKYEVYAKGIGMVHKYFKDYEILNGNPNNVKKGHFLEMKMVSYGN
ncbi:hypothetical protein [Fluviicola taffensis]|uniref:Lipoprotein n=1 Tax=Fluviicola taffensis (strain DSM 16823 / NCIMB 13979 / RW262) TaxID=755732 RepID=F2IIN7_FLUTR|nr:hypothetical protein [Fluviicola taffensis]AEA45999.1 hypothetical protein Fluta_4037 [Fluviicola taffensis DSM 16823]